jgi:hypothetical protein
MDLAADDLHDKMARTPATLRCLADDYCAVAWARDIDVRQAQV